MAKERDAPHDSSLNHIFTILVDGSQDIRRLGLDLSLNGQVEVDTDLFRLESFYRVKLVVPFGLLGEKGTYQG